MNKKFIIAVDQGTSATKCVLINKQGQIVTKASSPLGESYPAAGWVEQDPEEIWSSIDQAITACLDGRDPACVEAVAFSTQRESMLLWEKTTTKPLSNLISWQDQRTAAECEKMTSPELAKLVREKSGLPLDPMFSALKAKWLLDNFDPERNKAKAGKICLGTIDSFILSRLSGKEHITEIGNASRTQLLNIHTAAWDNDLLAVFNIPLQALAKVTPSVGPFPAIRGIGSLREGTPVMAVLGDSHAALFGHGAFKPGQVKATYGTGSSVMGLIDDSVNLHSGLCLTIAWQLAKPALAVEANIRSSGATIRWLANFLGITSQEVADLAEKADSESICLIPGFNGLGAPWWDSSASGIISGLSLNSRKENLARAALESIPNQITDVIEIMQNGGFKLDRLYTDGGPTRNKLLMQMQADWLDRPVVRSLNSELSALGVAELAGLGLGWWSWQELENMNRPQEIYQPEMPIAQRQIIREKWKKALEKAKSR